MALPMHFDKIVVQCTGNQHWKNQCHLQKGKSNAQTWWVENPSTLALPLVGTPLFPPCRVSFADDPDLRARNRAPISHVLHVGPAGLASPFETPQESVEAKAEDLEANTQKFKENAGSLRPSVNEMGKLQDLHHQWRCCCVSHDCVNRYSQSSHQDNDRRQ